MNKEISEVMQGAALACIGQLHSKVVGRRNYTIVRYANDKTYDAGGFGDMARRGLLEWSLRDMARRGISITCYTYKRDFDKDISVLRSLGFKG